jgi:NADPH-dependent 2,4-dienoyl-CoA reductase/sulfur reductase-like enzyme
MWKGEWCTVVVRKADAASRRYHVTFSDDEEDDVTVLTRDKLRAPKSKGPKPQPQPRRTIASAIPDGGDVAVPVGASPHPGGPDSAADVIIIGAGIAGLECARVLGAAGVRCTLLEARTRFGGRIHTDHTTFGFPIECGAHWIHGATKRNPLKQLADELGIQRVVTLDEEKLIDEHGTLSTSSASSPLCESGFASTPIR